MTNLIVHPARRPLRGSVPVPSDKSIGHRALLFGAIATGRSQIRGFSGSEDNVSTLEAMRSLGVAIEQFAPESVTIEGVGLRGFREPSRAIDCGNSGTTMRLLSGLLAGRAFSVTLTGDPSLSSRPMMRIARPLRQRGGRIEGRAHPKKAGEITAPLEVGGLGRGARLSGLEYESSVASAQVKSAVLLSGLDADGPTYFKEPHVSRDHTERMFEAMGVPLRVSGSVVELDPSGWNGELAPLDFALPGDLSAAAFLLVAAQLVEGSQVQVRHVGVNPTRTGVLDVLRDFGANLVVQPTGASGGEPVADLHAGTGSTVGRAIGGELVTRAIDEIPIVCALAARAKGETRIVDASELRVKESDRLVAMAGVLRAFGVECEELPDGIVIAERAKPLTQAVVESSGDHRIAMSAAVLALAADGPSVIRDVDCIRTSFPKFVGTLKALGAEIEVEG